MNFEYSYTPFDVIMQQVTYLNSFSMFDYWILAILVVWLIIFSFFIVPTVYITRQVKAKETEKRKKKNLIKQIALQKDIEEEIEKEIEADSQENASKTTVIES